MAGADRVRPGADRPHPVRLHLVRHAEAAAGYGTDHDPGLSERGRAQAAAVVAALVGVEPVPIRSSPLLRCRETAVPLARAWGVEVVVDPSIAEVAAPSNDLAERSVWVRRALASTWPALEPEPRAWHRRLLDHLRAVEHDAVLVTHFVAINAVIGAARGDDRVAVAPVANTSITVVEVVDGELHLVSAGDEADSEVL